MAEEFKWRLDEEEPAARPRAPTGRFKASRQSLPPEQRFTCLMDWHRDILWEKRAGGTTRRLLDVIIAKEFASRDIYGRGKPFELATADLKKARVSVRLKAEILGNLENWGIISVDQPNGKNPTITLILTKPTAAENRRG
jgi:hypothetical protein